MGLAARKPVRSAPVRRAGAVRVVRKPSAEPAANARVQEVPAAGFTAKQWLSFLSLVSLGFMSAIGVVYTTHENRMLVHELQQLENERNELQVEWGRLLLEQSSLVSQGRLETRAATELGMKVPAIENVVIVRRP